MRESKIRFPHYWIELPSDIPVIALRSILKATGWRIRWNNTLQDCTGRKGFIEVYHATH